MAVSEIAHSFIMLLLWVMADTHEYFGSYDA